MFYDMHIGFAVRARRLENATGRSNIKKTQQRRIDPDLRVPSIVTKANIPLENILIDKNDKENGVSLWLHENILHIFETNANLFPKYFLLLFLSLSIRKLSNELKRKLEIQQGRRRILRTRRKSGEICTKVVLIPRITQENTHTLGLFVARITSITRCIGEHLSISIERHRFLRQITTIGVSISNLYY